MRRASIAPLLAPCSDPPHSTRRSLRSLHSREAICSDHFANRLPSAAIAIKSLKRRVPRSDPSRGRSRFHLLAGRFECNEPPIPNAAASRHRCTNPVRIPLTFALASRLAPVSSPDTSTTPKSRMRRVAPAAIYSHMLRARSRSASASRRPRRETFAPTQVSLRGPALTGRTARTRIKALIRDKSLN